jgi:hypothetical protein
MSKIFFQNNSQKQREINGIVDFMFDGDESSNSRRLIVPIGPKKNKKTKIALTLFFKIILIITVLTVILVWIIK